jgi:hypothetical protein
MLVVNALNPRARRTHGTGCTPIRRQPERHRPSAEQEHDAAEREATQALERFLAGFGMAGEHGRRLTERLLAGARRHRRDHPQFGLAQCATVHAEEQFEAWLAALLGPELAAGQSALVAGRAAFLSCQGASAWPELVLVHDHLPEPFVTAMRAAVPPLAPMPAPATMPAQALESWSIVDATRAALDLLAVSFAWAANARPLVTTSIKLKSWS